MQISARADYALRATCVLATAPAGCVVKAGDIAAAQDVPRTFLDAILADLRRGGLVVSRRGPDGGHRLSRPAADITVADVVRVVDGPLALIHGHRPETLAYRDPAAHLQDVWVAVRASVRAIMELTTVADIVHGTLPASVRAHTGDDRSWSSVWPPPGH